MVRVRNERDDGRRRSQNGTFVDAVKLAAKQESPLRPGTSIRSGPIACRLITPDDLIDCCEAVAVQ